MNDKLPWVGIVPLDGGNLQTVSFIKVEKFDEAVNKIKNGYKICLINYSVNVIYLQNWDWWLDLKLTASDVGPVHEYDLIELNVYRPSSTGQW